MNEYYNMNEIIKIDNEYFNKYEFEEFSDFIKYYNVSYDEFIRIKYNIDFENDIYNDIYNVIS